MSSIVSSELVEPRIYDALTDRHEESWTYQRLDRDLNIIEEVDGVASCNIENNVNAEVRGSGSFSYLGSIDWRAGSLLRPIYTVKARESVASWSLGVFSPMSPRREHGSTRAPWEYQLYDRMMLLRDNVTHNSYSVLKGTNVIERVKHILTHNGYPQFIIDDSPEVLRTSITWEPGVSLLRIINDLLTAVNYFTIWADGNGVFRASPYKRPQNRPASYGFIDDAKGIYSPRFTEDRDTYGVPNKYVVISQGDTDTPAIRGYASDEDPGSPYSRPSTGRVLSAPVENADLTSTATAMAYAKRRLSELQQVTSSFDIEHAPIPIIGGDVVTFANSANDISVRAVVQKVSYSSTLGALSSTTLREVVGV